MNITFLVGNGFDINLGLKTGYSDVIKNYCNNVTDVNKIDLRMLGDENRSKAFDAIQQFKKCLSTKTPTNFGKYYWSDFEKGMGMYTSNFSLDNEDLYAACMSNFITMMSDYLLIEENKIDYDISRNAVINRFPKAIDNFYDDFSPKDKSEIQNVIFNRSEPVNIKFISLNYTATLDRCLEIACSKSKQIGKHPYGGTDYQHILEKEVIHAHGTLNNSVVLGLNDNTQIANKEIAQDDWFCDRYIKRKINDSIGSLQEIDAIKQINKSQIICLYGLSVGETDKFWWETIGAWLRENDKQLIIFSHVKGLENKSADPRPIIDEKDRMTKHFLKMAGLSDNKDLKRALKGKIHIIINSQIFGGLDLVDYSAENSYKNLAIKAAREQEEQRNIDIAKKLYEENVLPKKQ